jgi:hypothetical protein
MYQGIGWQVKFIIGALIMINLKHGRKFILAALAITSGMSCIAVANAQTAAPLSCAGFPKQTGTLIEVCRLTGVSAPTTPSITVITAVGNVRASGSESTQTISGSARILAKDTTLAGANALADSVKILTDGSVIRAEPNRAQFPKSIAVDFDIATSSATQTRLEANVGNVTASGYSNFLEANSATGNVTVSSVSGNVTAKTMTGNVTATVAGAGWVGQGLTATATTGNVSLVRPVDYAAKISAAVRVGNILVDGKPVTTPGVRRRTNNVTIGTGQPILLTTNVGNIVIRN